jgi:predicted molibdopterin-dependent oxidoreductase YjgC
MSDSTADAMADRRIHEHPVLGRDSRSTNIRITVNGLTLQAIEGESIAAALLANGVTIQRTMPETGTPRRYFCGIGRCADCLMVVDGELSVRTCVTQVRDGMTVETQDGLGAWKAVS